MYVLTVHLDILTMFGGTHVCQITRWFLCRRGPIYIQGPSHVDVRTYIRNIYVCTGQGIKVTHCNSYVRTCQYIHRNEKCGFVCMCECIGHNSTHGQ